MSHALAGSAPKPATAAQAPILARKSSFPNSASTSFNVAFKASVTSGPQSHSKPRLSNRPRGSFRQNAYRFLPPSSSIGSRLSHLATRAELNLRQDGRRGGVVGVFRRRCRAVRRPNPPSPGVVAVFAASSYRHSSEPHPHRSARAVRQAPACACRHADRRVADLLSSRTEAS